jgi:hypothetical protein
MIKDRAIETIEKFPVEPDAHIIYVVYNNDMVRASEDLICEVHGKEYLNDNVTVSPIGGTLPAFLDRKRCMMYFDPSLHSYIGNGQN